MNWVHSYNYFKKAHYWGFNTSRVKFLPRRYRVPMVEADQGWNPQCWNSWWNYCRWLDCYFFKNNEHFISIKKSAFCFLLSTYLAIGSNFYWLIFPGSSWSSGNRWRTRCSWSTGCPRTSWTSISPRTRWPEQGEMCALFNIIFR